MNAELSRMADFQMWGEACESAMGLAPGSFAEAYLANREDAALILLESNPLILALLKYLKKNGPQIEDTATDLLEKLSYANYRLKDKPGWPKTPRVLSAILKRVAPNLRQIGIVAEQDTRGGGDSKEKIWRICGPCAPETPNIKAGRKSKKKKPHKKHVATPNKTAITASGRKTRKGRKKVSKVSRRGKK